MAELALILYGVFGLVTIGIRVLIHRRLTGSSGVRGLSGRPGSAEWLGGVAFVAALAVLAIAPVLALVEVSPVIEPFDKTAVQVAGVALFTVGIAGTFFAQGAMGRSWRIGVDEGELTGLVVAGPFAIVRNPIYSAMIPALAGLVLISPSPLAIAGIALLIGSLELQTRFVEEPYLMRTHGLAYAVYAARVGRFFPGIGRISRDQ